MASIVDSIKLVFTDNNAYIKLAAIAVIPYYLYSSYNGYILVSKDFDYYLKIVLILYYMGYMFGILNNSIREKDYILPNLFAPSAILRGIKPIISCGVFLYPVYLYHIHIVPKIEMTYIGGKILAVVGYLSVVSFFVSSVILYSAKEKILDGYNILIIINIFHEVIVYLIYSALLLVIFNAITSAPLLTAIYGLFGYGKIFSYMVCFLVTANFAIYFQNLSHLYFELIRE